MRTFQRVFIVAENALVVNGLKHRISRRFGDAMQVKCFYDFKTCLRHIKSGCEVIIVDPELDGKKAEDVFRSVRLINPSTRGIVHHDESQVLNVLEQFIPQQLQALAFGQAIRPLS